MRSRSLLVFGFAITCAVLNKLSHTQRQVVSTRNGPNNRSAPAALPSWAEVKSGVASPHQFLSGTAPGPGIASFFTDVRTFRQDPLGSFLRYTLKFGDVVRYRGLWITHQITHPE